MSSCASIFCGSKAKVTFDSDISRKATLTIDGRKHKHVTFPYTTKIRRGFDETIVKAEAPGFTAEPVIVNKNFNAVSVLNLLVSSRGASMLPQVPLPSQNSSFIKSIFSRTGKKTTDPQGK